jgi:hypothetical protein
MLSTEMEDESKEATEDHGFHSRKTAEKEQPPKCMNKFAPHFKNLQWRNRCPPKCKKITPHSSKKFSKKMIDREIHHFKKNDWTQCKETR